MFFHQDQLLRGLVGHFFYYYILAPLFLKQVLVVKKDHPLSISGICIYIYILYIYPTQTPAEVLKKKPRKTYRKQKTPNLRRYLLDVYAGDTNIYIKPTSKPNRSMKKRIQVGGKHSLKFQPSLPETNSKST